MRDSLLPAVGHAVSGGVGTAISTVTTYPLDLVNTRLKVQRQLHKDGSISADDRYRSIAHAFRTIYRREGGLAAFYAGLGSDVAKSVADSFLFFLFYNWFRTARTRRKERLGAVEELAIGAAAGACARFFTTPISNVVTRKQTAAVVSGGRGESGASTREIIDKTTAESGLLGLWRGYSANLVLTLNPSITFFMDRTLRQNTASWTGREASDAAGITFLLAAVSKVIATAITFPFQAAKARVQVAAPAKKGEEREIDLVDEEAKAEGDGSETETVKALAVNASRAVTSGVRDLANDSIIATMARIARTEGILALYDGIGGELLKAFFNHGTTMLSKGLVHKLIVQLYFTVVAALKRLSKGREALLQRSQNASETFESRPHRISSPTSINRMVKGRARSVRRASDDGGGIVITNMLGGSQRTVKR